MELPTKRPYRRWLAGYGRRRAGERTYLLGIRQGAGSGRASELPDTIDAGWTEIASEEAVERRGRIDLDAAGRDFTHYLIWITAIPADEGKVEIAEAQLLR